MGKIVILTALFLVGCAQEDSLEYPGLWTNPDLAHVVEFRDKTEKVGQLEAYTNDKTRRLIETYENTNPDIVDKVLSISKKSHDCLVRARLPDSFYHEMQSRHGHLGWTIDGKKEYFPKDRTKIKSSKHYILKLTAHRESQIQCLSQLDKDLTLLEKAV